MNCLIHTTITDAFFRAECAAQLPPVYYYHFQRIDPIQIFNEPLSIHMIIIFISFCQKLFKMTLERALAGCSALINEDITETTMSCSANIHTYQSRHQGRRVFDINGRLSNFHVLLKRRKTFSNKKPIKLEWMQVSPTEVF